MKAFSILHSCIVAALLTLSCSGDKNAKSTERQELPADSAQLRIAVTPTLDCLPVCVASERGFFEEANLDVRLLPYVAQMDCDTALQRGHANGIVSDLVRVHQMNAQGDSLHIITATDAHWQLLTDTSAHITTLSQLDDHMLAMTRFSATHLLSDKMVDSAGIDPDRVFLIQVNDLNVRLRMLRTGIMPALFLPEPQASKARSTNGRVLMDTREHDYRLGVVAFRRSAATAHNITSFMQAYDKAVDSLNVHGIGRYKEIAERWCDIDRVAADSLKGTQFSHATAPRQSDVRMVDVWLKRDMKNQVED